MMLMMIGLILTGGALSAAGGGTPIGPNVSNLNGEDLKWEEGSRDYFVMFKSLVARVTGEADANANNPQADSCIDPNIGSTYTLLETTIPPDAYVDRAFLVWVANANPAALDSPTDNTVRLSFTQRNGAITYAEDLTSPVSGTLTTPPSFQYEGFKTEYVPSGISVPTCNTDTDCQNNQQAGPAYSCIGGKCGLRFGTFTYRMEVTDFFRQIHELGAEAGFADGESLLGNYTVSGLDCFVAPQYLVTSGMVGGWMLAVIYRSEAISPKKIYFYNGLQWYQYQSQDIQVSGFELPNEAELRVTLVAAEGDPGLFDALKPQNLEGLQLHGPIDTAAAWLPIFNNCNPPVSNYYEIYNSISSFYGWADQTEFCIGDYASKMLEYSIDVDQFLIRAKDEPFATHLHKGDTFFWLKIGANQDMVYTNFMLLSLDTKAPKFDIPADTAFAPDGREKLVCSCSNELKDSVCHDRPFYYLIKVQNWGENLADNVTVQDVLPTHVDYIAGSTEMTTEIVDGNGINWKAVPDGAGGAFPFANPTQVHAQMGYCDKEAKSCPDSVYVRFKVQPKAGLPKNIVIENSATISDSSNLPYYTNTSVPLRARLDQSCVSTATCPEPSKALCGGDSTAGCTSKDQCAPGQNCVEGQCVEDTSALTNGAQIEFAPGKNSPVAEGAIIIPASSTGVLLGQFTVNGKTSGGETDKVYQFKELKLKIVSDDANVQLSNLKLIHDADGSGLQNGDEAVVATAASVSAGQAVFTIAADKRAFAANTLQYFIVTTDTGYGAAEITTKPVFNGAIEGAISFLFADASGDLTATGDKIDFASYMLEPTADYFIFTRGAHDPSVPAPTEMNKDIAVLHIRLKSLDEDNALRSLEFKTTASSVRFGQGIKGISLWDDADGNGSADTLLFASEALSGGSESYTFAGTESKLAVTKGVERHLVVKLSLSLAKKETAQIEIQRTGIQLTTTKNIIELPLVSKAFTFDCPEGDVACENAVGGGDEEDSGCGCSVVPVEQHLSDAIIALFALLGLIIVRRRMAA